ncbi:MAG: hypothetical protein ACC655_11900, partial [Rhodothermia bacterium]
FALESALGGTSRCRDVSSVADVDSGRFGRMGQGFPWNSRRHRSNAGLIGRDLMRSHERQLRSPSPYLFYHNRLTVLALSIDQPLKPSNLFSDQILAR